jgi:curved DNA-binding protein CbpA
VFRSALKILKINPEDDKDECHRKYVRMVRRYPPEHFPDKFKKISDAYHELTLNDSVVDKKISDFNLQTNKFKLASFFWADRLDLTSSDAILDNLDDFFASQKAWEDKQKLISSLDASKIQYRKVKL